MKLDYEKHQRDYTVLASVEIIEELFSQRIKKYFFYTPHKIYMLVEDGIFYHYIMNDDWSGLVLSWFKKRSYSDLKKYEKETSRQLIKYRKFLKQEHKKSIDGLLLLHEYMRIFLPIIAITAYIPMYHQNYNKKVLDFCLKFRKKYEDIHKVGMTLQKKLLNELEKELKIKKNCLQYLTSSEFREFLKSKKLPKGLSQRKKFIFIELFKNSEKILSKKQAKNKLKKLDKYQLKNLSKKRIKGNVAFAGVAKGRVKIIKLVEDARYLKSGDILVASMTDPRYVPAMKKAVAVITDEGGITCHAAIVSRELKIPCIVGTKIATRVLKDGDKVEVDADKGVVKIIK